MLAGLQRIINIRDEQARPKTHHLIVKKPSKRDAACVGEVHTGFRQGVGLLPTVSKTQMSDAADAPPLRGEEECIV